MSFLDYYLDRKEGIINPSPFAEMAAPSIKMGGEDVYEKRKVPVFLDQDDIDYLYQFPPAFWSQALSYRYGNLIYESHKATGEKTKLKDVQDVVLQKGGRGGGQILFKGIDTKINSLYHKLTADVDDEMLSTIGKSPEDRAKYAEEMKRRALHYYGFVLEGFKKSTTKPQLGASKGYIMLTKHDASKRLGSLRHGIQEGWLGEHPKDATYQQVSFAGGRSKKKTWVHSYDELSELPGSGRKYGRTKDGKRIWYAYKKQAGKWGLVKFRDFLPVLKPATMVDSHAVRSYNEKMRHHKQIVNDIGDENFETYYQVANPSLRPQWEKRLENLNGWFEKPENQKPKRGEDKKQTERREKTKERKRILNVLGSVNAASELIKKDGGNPKELYQDPDVLRKYLQRIAENLHGEAKMVQKAASRYDLHDWNVHHFNPNFHNLHTSATGFGTINVNWQQKEAVHGALLKMGVDPEDFWNTASQYIVGNGSEVAQRPGKRKKKGQEDAPDPGPLVAGINMAFRKGTIMNDAPVYAAMAKNWQGIFDNAKNYLRGFIGSKNFYPFMRQYNMFVQDQYDTTTISPAFRKMEVVARNKGYDFVIMVYQLKSRMANEPQKKEGINLGDVLNSEHLNNKLDQDAQEIVKLILWNRTNRPYDPDEPSHGDPGRTTHDISWLHRIMDEDVQSRILQAVQAEKTAVATAMTQLQNADEGQKRLTKTIIDTGVAYQLFRHVYYWTKQQLGEPYTELEANAFANRAIDGYLQKRGSLPSVSTTPSVPKAIRTQANPEMAQSDRQVEYLAKLNAFLQHANTKAILDKKSPSFDPQKRAFLDKIVQDKQLGHILVQKKLEEIDGKQAVVKNKPNTSRRGPRTKKAGIGQATLF
jgi:hypothetical protein